ncbi:uncharacterized protein Z520_00425 [Fonsecaea multimorphosa CBS 102226]|uniref:Uncharacterized protein n=1 Tax=Fonsecaea multimorphosa CBS 102226 TaxID=1442371 RepID=A0A0D2L3U8_9EURO|nr:uncharacterized protein Z520_00425 [Fonsecaea multimorphosa CBS 102226]KIY03734.1 hypothetical protein Z520_00425 [Fonsecaea multimorphosa CBS 102226]
MQPSEPDHNSLDDSWASLADVESSNEDDLQSEHTDVGSLLDVHSSDDVQSVSDEVYIHDGASSDEDGLEDTLREALHRRPTLIPRTEQGFSYPDPPPSPQIVYSEQEVGQDEQGPSGTYTTSRPLSEQEARKLLDRGHGEGETLRCLSVIRMPVLESGLDLNVHNYFKVLLLGRHVEQFRPELQRKLGDVLVSRPVTSHNVNPTSVSRYHVVPNTFGPGAEPDFADLVAIDKLIDFDCYDLIQSSGSLGQQEDLILRNSQTYSEIVSKWTGSRLVVGNPRWTVPDIAIICVNLNDEGCMNNDSCQMISFVEQLGIPKILIRMDRGWDGDYRGSVTSDSLHECIETRPQRPMQVQHKFSPKLPLDMAAFLNLDATVLNKHIAYAVSSAEQNHAGEDDGLDSSSKEPCEKPGSEFSLLPPVSASLIKNVFIVLWIVGVYSFLGFGLWPILTDPSSGAASDDIIASVTAQEQAPSTRTDLSMPTLATSTHSGSEESQSAQQLLDIASVNLIPAVADDVLHFQVGIAGEGQLLVRLPKIALSRKKRSPLSVELKRKNQTLPVSVQELFEGVFSVHLQPHDAHGDIEVNLTMSKPQLSETFTVSLGDRSTSEFQRLKELLNMLSGHVQETASSFSDYWKAVRERFIADDLALFPRLTKEGMHRGKPLNATWSFLSKLTPFDIRLRLREETQTLHGKMVRMSQGYAMAGKKFGNVLSGGLANARLRVFDTVESINVLRHLPSFNRTTVFHHLGAAQGRAKQLVTKAARKLRVPKARA